MVALQFENLTQSFSKGKERRVVLSGISLKIHQSEVLCFLGSNGCGKTTLINILSGLTQPERGDIFVRSTLGDSMVSLNVEKDEFRKFARVCQQNDYLYEDMTVREHFNFFSML